MAPPKKVKAIVKMQIQAGQANPGNLGTVLGPHGVAMMDFCTQFNAQTKDKAGYVIPAEMTIFEDRSFTFILKTPPATDLIKKAVGIQKGSAEANKIKVGKITRAQLKEIAETKMQDLNAFNIDAAINIIAGTAINMGVEVEG